MYIQRYTEMRRHHVPLCEPVFMIHTRNEGYCRAREYAQKHNDVNLVQQTVHHVWYELVCTRKTVIQQRQRRNLKLSPDNAK